MLLLAIASTATIAAIAPVAMPNHLKHFLYFVNFTFPRIRFVMLVAKHLKIIYILAIGLYFTYGRPLQAQVIPDRTLPVNSRVTNSGNSHIIEGGTVKGANLFHSFKYFSIPKASTVYFNNAASIGNIFTRITGSQISDLNGLLKNNGSANLFFFNPNGIIFGSNFRLNIGGSLLAATADRIDFAGGSFFSSLDPDRSILTNSLPVSITINNSASGGDIQVVGGGHQLIYNLPLPIRGGNIPPGLSVLPGKSIALLGKNITFDGGEAFAPGGDIQLYAVESGSVNLRQSPRQFRLETPSNTAAGQIQLSRRSLLNASGNGNAHLELYGKNISLSDGSVILMQNRGSSSDSDLKLSANESIKISGSDPIARIPGGIFAETVGLGKSATIRIFSPRLSVESGGQINTKTFSLAPGGDIFINAPQSLEVLNASPFGRKVISLIATLTLGRGTAGSINVITPRLNIEGGGTLSSGTNSNGRGGNVNITADTVRISGYEPTLVQRSSISSSTAGSGTAGNINIDARNVFVGDGGAIAVSTIGYGNGGNLKIYASDTIEVSGRTVGAIEPTSVTSGAFLVEPALRRILSLPDIPTGNSGSLSLKAARLIVRDGAIVSARNQGTGDAGSVFVRVPEIFLTSEGSITAATASGNGGEITINSSDFRLNNASITATAGNNGNGGNINIDTDALVLDNSSITANAFSGNGGNIDIETGVLLQKNTNITASSQLGIQGQVQVNQFISPNAIYLTEPSLAPASDIVLEANCSLSSPRFTIEMQGEPALPDSLEFASNNLDVEANTLIKGDDGTVALTYIPPEEIAPYICRKQP